MSETPNQPAQGGSAKLVIIAAVLALLAVVLVNIYIEMVRQETQAETFTIYRLKRSIYPGDELNPRDVQPVQVPEQFADAFESSLKEKDLLLEQDRGTFQRHAPQGALLTFELFQRPDEAEFDRRITPGKRLVSLPVNSKTIPGNLRPGMFVDVEAPFMVGGGVPEVLPVLERAKVVAVGQHTVMEEQGVLPGRGLTSYRTIAIEVEPVEATQLGIIQRMAAGEFELHLRNPGDMAHPKIPEGGINPVVLEMLRQPTTGQANRRD